MIMIIIIKNAINFLQDVYYNISSSLQDVYYNISSS
jgi:hypothetical protein